MVLVDTSIWIRSLAGRQPYAAELHRLLGLNQVSGHELVFGELLIGDQGGRRKTLAAYERMEQASLVPHSDVVAFARDRELHGSGVGRIDVHLLASALVGKLQLWTADERFSAVATELGIAYHIRASEPGRQSWK
ncbi:MAG: type II toxin-antitoxin system VapC family toxin [Bryobacteraceae bacterium]